MAGEVSLLRRRDVFALVAREVSAAVNVARSPEVKSTATRTKTPRIQSACAVRSHHLIALLTFISKMVQVQVPSYGCCWSDVTGTGKYKALVERGTVLELDLSNL